MDFKQIEVYSMENGVLLHHDAVPENNNVHP